MNRKIKNAVAASVLALGLGSGVAQADPFVNGSLSAGGAMGTSGSATAIVSDLVNLVINPIAIFGPGIDDFSAIFYPTVGAAGGFSTAAPAGIIYSVGGFTFTITSVSAISTVAFSCTAQGQCSDQLLFNFTGEVSGPGYAATDWSGAWNAQGSCTGTIAGCTGGKTATWSSSLSALGTNVPEPGSLALLGLGLGALSLVRRRKQA